MKKIIIDAGHGGTDPGAGGHGLKEKDITLKISQEVAKRLNANYEGVQATLTRSADVTLGLKQRTDLANKQAADVLVSVHVNAGGGKGGFESFTFNGVQDAATTALQSSIHGEIMAQLKPFNVIDRGKKRANLHMCRESAMPAVLTECLFIDVATDAALLKRADVIEAFIKGHVLGIAKHLGLKAKQTQPAGVVGVFVNGQYVGKGKVENGVTMVPGRVVCEALGANITYDKNTNRVDIKK